MRIISGPMTLEPASGRFMAGHKRRISIDGRSVHCRAAFTFSVLFFVTLAIGRMPSARITAATISGIVRDETGAALRNADRSRRVNRIRSARIVRSLQLTIK